MGNNLMSYKCKYEKLINKNLSHHYERCSAGYVSYLRDEARIDVNLKSKKKSFNTFTIRLNGKGKILQARYMNFDSDGINVKNFSCNTIFDVINCIREVSS